MIREGTKLNNWKFGFDWDQKRKGEVDRALKIVSSLRSKTTNETNNEYQHSENAEENKVTPQDQAIK